jgi:hypothetical protein
MTTFTNYNKLIPGLLLPVFLFGQSCNSKPLHKSEERDIVYAKVSLEHLLDSLGNYHNKPVETAAYFVCGFERHEIMPEVPHEITPPGGRYYDWSRSIWINEQYSRSMLPCNSVNKRIVVVRGVLDTSQHGHLGEYKATIKEAVIQLP